MSIKYCTRCNGVLDSKEMYYVEDAFYCCDCIDMHDGLVCEVCLEEKDVLTDPLFDYGTKTKR